MFDIVTAVFTKIECLPCGPRSAWHAERESPSPGSVQYHQRTSPDPASAYINYLQDPSSFLFSFLVLTIFSLRSYIYLHILYIGTRLACNHTIKLCPRNILTHLKLPNREEIIPLPVSIRKRMTAVLNFFFRSKAWYGNTGALQSLPVVSLFPKRNPPSV